MSVYFCASRSTATRARSSAGETTSSVVELIASKPPPDHVVAVGDNEVSSALRNEQNNFTAAKDDTVTIGVLFNGTRQPHRQLEARSLPG